MAFLLYLPQNIFFLMTIIILLAVLALLLGFLEIFVIPGFGFAGIGSIVCAVVDAVLIYQGYGMTAALVTTAVGVALLLLALWWMAHSRTLDRMSLSSTISSTNATPDQLSVKVGDEGRALTRLALVGNAEIEGKQVEVKSSGAFINPGTRVRVTAVSEANITVEAVAD